MLKQLLILMLLIAPCIASENRTYSTDEVLQMITIARFGGWGEAGGIFDALTWDAGQETWKDHFDVVTAFNRHIQAYNQMMREHFNQTMQERDWG